MDDYVEKIKADVIEQFKDKPNLSALLEVFGEQIEELASFFTALKENRNINTATGTQLDGVGDIAVLTRGEAGGLASISNPGEELNDEVYRNFLKYKLWKNANICTYSDIIRSFQMFWDLPLHYKEEIDQPATMILYTDILAPADNADILFTAPIIKAAGVKLCVEAISQTEEFESKIKLCSVLGGVMSESILPDLRGGESG